MRLDPKWHDKLSDYLDSLAGAFVLGSMAAAFLLPIIWMWFLVGAWLK